MFAPRVKRQQSQQPRLPFFVRRPRVLYVAILMSCVGIAFWLDPRNVYVWFAVWAGSHFLTGFVKGCLRKNPDSPASDAHDDDRVCRSVHARSQPRQGV